MRKLWKIVGIASLVAILGLVAIGAVVYAQNRDSSGWPFDFGHRFKEALADILGISVDKYDAAVDQAHSKVIDEALAEGWLTEEQAEILQWRMDQAPELGHGGMMPKGFGLDRGMMGGVDSLTSIVAEKLDLSITDLLTELQDGKTIADVASDKGVDLQVIVDAYVAQVKESLDEAVADGRITQKQADWQLEQVIERVTDQLNSTWEDHSRGGMRRGGMMGIPGMGGL
jgi:polyhydroxyalkanoate synthesis regulator phasin